MESQTPTDLPQDLTLSYRPPAAGAVPDAEGTMLPRWTVAVDQTASGSGGSVAPPTAAPPGGTAIFRLRKQIARGGMGEVWEGVQESLGRVVAVKRIRRDRAVATSGDLPMDAILGSFRQEALTAASLDHPNIVPIHDLGRDEEGHPLLAMKLVKGKPWNSVLREDAAAMDFSALLAKHIPILASVTQAVAFAHSRGIVHRDLKPSQVMLGEFGEVLLMDWGLALLHDSEALAKATGGMTPLGLATRDTASNPAGTVAYMAPEQTERGAERIGPWTDVYLLGAMLYEILTGHPPHRGTTPAMAYMHAHEGRIVPMGEAAPGRAIPTELADLAMEAMQVQVDRRVASARAFLDRLQEYLGGESRRRESRALCVAAEAALVGSPGYRDLADAIVRLEQAQSLWPANERAAKLRTEAIAAYARAALRGGDLTLARVQTERLAAGPETDALLREVALGEEAQRRTLATRRLAIVASFTLLLLLVTVGSGFTISLNEARRDAEQQRDLAQAERDRASAAEGAAVQREREAVAARAQSDSLVSFMITDLRERIAPLDPTLESLREVAVRAQDHFTSQSLVIASRDERDRVHRGLVDVGLVLLEQSEVDRARAAFERSVEVASAGVEAASGAPAPELAYWTAMEAESLTHVGNTASRRGALSEEAGILERAQTLIARAAELDPGRSEWGRELASMGLRMAQTKNELGHTDASREELLRVLPVIEGVIARDPSEPEAPGILAGTLNLLGVLARGDGDTTAALGYFEGAAAAQTRQTELQPELLHHRMNLAAILASRSAVHRTLGRTDEAMAGAGEAYRIMKDLLDQQPGNTQYLHYYTYMAMFYLQASSETMEAPQTAEIQRSVIAVRRRLLEREPENTTFVRNLANTLETHAIFIGEKGKELDPPMTVSEALEIQEEAVALAASLETKVPRTVWLQDWLLTCSYHADLLELAGRRADALRRYEDNRNAVGELAESGTAVESLRRVHEWTQGYSGLLYTEGRYGESRDVAQWGEQLLRGIRDKAADRRHARGATLRIAELLRLRTDALLCLGEWEAARDAAVARAETLEPEAGSDPAVAEDRDLSLLWSADAILWSGDAAAALSTVDSALAAATSSRVRGIAHALRAEALEALGRHGEAIAAADLATPLLRAEIEAAPQRLTEPGFLARALLAKGTALAATGGVAVPTWREALAGLQSYTEAPVVDPHRALMPQARLLEALGDPALEAAMQRLCATGYVPARVIGAGCDGPVR